MSKLIFLSVLGLLISSSAVSIDLGELDTSFSQDGSSDGWDISGDTGFNREGSDIVVDSLGRLIIVGYFEYELNGQQLLSARVERRLPDGTLDTSFHGNGYYELLLEPSATFKFDIEVKLDGNDGFFVGHTTLICTNGAMCHNDVIIYHFNSSGSQSGAQIVSFNYGDSYERWDDNFADMVYLPSVNRLAITATVEASNSDDTDYGVAMLHVDSNNGSLSIDTGFYSNGINRCYFDQNNFSGSSDIAEAIDYDPQTNHLIVGGSTFEGNGLNSDGWNMSFCEFDLQGNLIDKWSTESLPDVFYDQEFLEDLSVVRANNSLYVVAAGSFSGAGELDFSIVRYEYVQPIVNQSVQLGTSWQLDTSFGSLGNGFGSTSFQHELIGDTLDEINEIVIQEDGSILVAGFMYWEENFVPYRRVALAKYTPNGILDTNWGISDSGTATHTFNQNRSYDNAHAIALDPSTEAIFVAGYSIVGSDRHSLVAKMHNDLIFGSNFDF